MSDIDKISKEVASDRARLAGTLDALRDTVAPQSVVHDVSAAASDIGGVIAEKAWKSLREQPAGAILVTLGLGLLAAGSQRQAARPAAATPTAVHPDTAYVGFEDRVEKAEAEIRANMTGEMEDRPSANALKQALNSGLDKLPPKARKRVVDARRAVIKIQEEVERKSRKTARRTKGFINEQPLAAGAIAAGFGVLAAALLPSTRREDALMGQKRDALMTDARLALEDEMMRAKVKAEHVLSEKVGSPRDDARI